MVIRFVWIRSPVNSIWYTQSLTGMSCFQQSTVAILRACLVVVDTTRNASHSFLPSLSLGVVRPCQSTFEWGADTIANCTNSRLIIVEVSFAYSIKCGFFSLTFIATMKNTVGGEKR